MSRIFISYRRMDSQTITGRINDRLIVAFGARNVFKDVDDIPPGVDFRQVISKALSQKVIVLVIIGPGWLNARDHKGNRRLDDPGDFVRIEVKTALERDDARVVPVLVDGAEMPHIDDLPEDLRSLAFRNAVVIRQDPDFHRDVQRLIKQIQDGQMRLTARTVILIAIGVLVLALAAVAYYAIQQGVYIGTPTSVARGLPSETPNNLTVAVQNLTSTAAAERTLQAPSATNTPDEVQTLMAQIRLSETARVTNEPLIAPATDLPEVTLTPTFNLTRTARADQTQAADAAAYAATSTAEELTQRQQQLENTPTITSMPTRTATRTPSPTLTLTSTLTATLTLTPDFTATSAAISANETRIYEAALATQVSAKATAEAGNIIAYYENPDGVGLNVRTEPGGEVVATINPGEFVVIVDETEDGGWSQVRLPSDVTGWSSSSLLTLLGTPTPPPNATAVWRLAETGVELNRAWTSYIQMFDGVPMALVPRGCFLMGSDQVSDESPRTEQCIDEPFWLDVYEVSNDQFTDFNGQARQQGNSGGGGYPRNNVSWEEARAYCEQARSVRLPTELEWEFAARGPGNLSHTWGGQFFIFETAVRLVNFCDENCSQDWRDADYDDRFAEVGPVTAFPANASWVGAVNLNGNLWEWVSTAYDTDTSDNSYPYPYSAADGRENLDDDNVLRVVRGGSWLSTLAETRSSNRDRYGPKNAIYDVGFRCARDAEMD